MLKDSFVYFQIIITYFTCLIGILQTAPLPSPQTEIIGTSTTEPVIFHKETNLKVSRSTIDASVIIDLRGIWDQFNKLHKYIDNFIQDARDPQYVATLAQREIGPFGKFMGEGITSKETCPPYTETATFHCKIMYQYKQIMRDTLDIQEVFKQRRKHFKSIVNQMTWGQTLKDEDKGKREKRTIHDYLYNEEVFQQLSYHDKHYITTLLMVLTNIHDHPNYQIATYEHLQRRKRFDLFSLFLGWTAFSQAKTIEKMKENINILRDNQQLQKQQIEQLADYLNMTIEVVNRNSQELVTLNLQLYAMNQTLMNLIRDVNGLQIVMSVINDLRNSINIIRTGILAMENNVRDIEDTLRIMATHKANPLMLPPKKLKRLLTEVQETIKADPRLELPEDPEHNIWVYYQFISITPIVMEDYMVVMITIPLLDKSLQVELYRAYSLPALHPELGVEFQYELENEYIGTASHGLFALLPSADEIRICKATNGYYCYFQQALYPTGGNQWCIYALFVDNKTAIEEYCTMKIRPRYQNMAVNIEGFLWAVSSFIEESLHVRCLAEDYIQLIHPPLEIITVPNGCAATSSTLYIPARSEVTLSIVETNLTTEMIEFNHQYTKLDTYHAWKFLEMVDLADIPAEVKQQISNRLTSLPPMKMKLFKQQYKKLGSYPFSMPASAILTFTLTYTIFILVVIIFIIWQVKKNRKLLQMVSTLYKTPPPSSETLKWCTPEQSRQRFDASFRNKNRKSPEKTPTGITIEPSTSTQNTGDIEMDIIHKPSLPPRMGKIRRMLSRKSHYKGGIPTPPGKPTSSESQEETNQPSEGKVITSGMLEKVTKRLIKQGYNVHL